MKAALDRESDLPANNAGLASKGSRTRQRLLDATAAEVARHGVAGASINAIAAAAGLKTGSVYFHYQSKDLLIEAMLEEGLLRSRAFLETALAALPPESDAATRLVAAIRAHAKAVYVLRDYTIAVLAPSFPHDTAGAIARKLRRTYGLRWTQLITDAQNSRALPSGPSPRLLRDLIFGALNAVGLGRTSPRHAADALIALLGFRERPSGQAQD